MFNVNIQLKRLCKSCSCKVKQNDYKSSNVKHREMLL
jgi:hypothetical protein